MKIIFGKMVDEFKWFGLFLFFNFLIGVFEIVGVIGMLIGIWILIVVLWVGLLLGGMMFVVVLMLIVLVRDFFKKVIFVFVLFVFSLGISLYYIF